MRVRGSCGVTTARTKGTLAFRVRNDRGELVPIHLEVITVPNFLFSGTNVILVGALNEKGVNLDLMADPPVSRDANSAFPVSTEYPRTFVPRILLNGHDKSRDKISMDTDSCHRRMDTCRPRAMKQLAEELTTGANYDIDSSGAGKPTVIGYTLAELRTDDTVGHGSAELATGKGIIQNVNHGSAELVTGKGISKRSRRYIILTQETTARTTPEAYGIAHARRIRVLKGEPCG